MRRFRAAFMLALLLAPAAAPAFAQSARRARLRLTRPATTSVLARRIDRLLDDPPFDRALWGVAIADPSGTVVFERNGDRLFVPASNTKLVVSAVAAALLPAGFRWTTSLYSAGAVSDSVLNGDLVLYGRGDPTLSDRYYPTAFAPFEELADSLRARGILRIEGDLIADASWFDSTATHPSWESYDLTWWYAAPVTALGYNDNSVELHVIPMLRGTAPYITIEPDLGMVTLGNQARTVGVDAPRTIDFHRRPGTNVFWADGDVPVDARPWTESVAVADGPAWAAAGFRHALESRGIALSGRTRTTSDPAATAAARTLPPLAEHASPELRQVLEPVLQLSHNWYAEMLLKTLGRMQTGTGSWDSGLAVERRFLVDSLHVDSSAFRLADGSGLSHWNLISPRALVQLLFAMRAHPRSELFREAMAVGGSSGTLRYRYRSNALQGRVVAKTGSIANVTTLSGYLETPAGPWTFSIQLNNHTLSTRDVQKRIDMIVAELER
ncbi:MAG: D-alanyl-D-alanine carboxypeptidase/D-alanyl-D-alanine-endopeptidase [Gemmatimonadales bacterium]